MQRFAQSISPDFLAVATPGAGKTTFALLVARDVVARSLARLVVVVPTAHLKIQWARAASALDLHLDAKWSPAMGDPTLDFHGIVTTYQQVAVSPTALQHLANGAFVILDEVHHAGDDRSWGTALQIAFAKASRRLSMSGTPFRSDSAAIPFVNYHFGEAQPDFEHGYGEALAERRVVRPIYFPRVSGHMEWSGPDGSVHEATFEDQLDQTLANQRLRTALSLEGDWLTEVLQSADAKLAEVRERHGDAGGLVIASDQTHARGIARIMAERLGTVPDVATSDDPMASAVITRFANSKRPWLVAVRMVSEGVDIPRLRVGVFATNTTTELFFRQAAGRFVRFVPGLARQSAYLFIPDDPRLKRFASEIASTRRHLLGRRASGEEDGDESGDFAGFDDSRDQIAAIEGTMEQLSLFSVISAVATGAVDADGEVHDDVIGDRDDPSLLVELAAMPSLGRNAPLNDPRNEPKGLPPTKMEDRAGLRAQNAAVARALSRRTGWSHAKVNAELNRLAGLSGVGGATTEQLAIRLMQGERLLAKM